MNRDELYAFALEWRGVPADDVCRRCGGSGVRSYGSTATWRGGVGGQMATSDVCDACWGTGRRTVLGANLRRLERSVLPGRVCAELGCERKTAPRPAPKRCPEHE